MQVWKQIWSYLNLWILIKENHELALEMVFKLQFHFFFLILIKRISASFFLFFFFSGSVSHCSTFFFFTFSYLWENEVPSVLLCNPSTCVPHGWDICNYNFLLFCSTLILPLPPSRNEANKKTNKPTELHRI